MQPVDDRRFDGRPLQIQVILDVADLSSSQNTRQSNVVKQVQVRPIVVAARQVPRLGHAMGKLRRDDRACTTVGRLLDCLHLGE